jgi:hypothetical protein
MRLAIDFTDEHREISGKRRAHWQDVREQLTAIEITSLDASCRDRVYSLTSVNATRSFTRLLRRPVRFVATLSIAAKETRCMEFESQTIIGRRSAGKPVVDEAAHPRLTAEFV